MREGFALISIEAAVLTRSVTGWDLPVFIKTMHGGGNTFRVCKLYVLCEANRDMFSKQQMICFGLAAHEL